MNRTYHTGYIATDIELKHTGQGVPVLSFQLAVKRPKCKNDITDFFTIVCWRGTAEFVARNFQKGSGVEVTGTLTTREWDDNNGNKRIFTEIVADDVEFGKNSKPKNDNKKADDTVYPHPDFTDDNFTEITDDDVPF